MINGPTALIQPDLSPTRVCMTGPRSENALLCCVSVCCVKRISNREIKDDLEKIKNLRGINSLSNEAAFCLGYEAALCLGYEAALCLGYEAALCLGYEAALCLGNEAALSLCYECTTTLRFCVLCQTYK